VIVSRIYSRVLVEHQKSGKEEPQG
jgi:hypothetical protein